jgi:glutaryl-CoA dehydrogenase (non-decarboxylating)
MFALEQGRFTVAAGATRVIRASRDASVTYALERETFGTKIANHQLVKQKIAEMEADYQMTRLLWLRAGHLKNTGQANAKATSLAKWHATVRSEKAASMAIEVHGANGYSNDYPVERYLRNCKAAIIYEGTRDIHTLMQADWALGLKKEKPARKTLPPFGPA